jgi:hypothetical protein
METPQPNRSKLKILMRNGVALFMILGPLWGYIAMFICKMTDGGQVFDTVTFYMMLIGWMMAPIGILLLLYGIVTRSILEQRRNAARR